MRSQRKGFENKSVDTDAALGRACASPLSPTLYLTIQLGAPYLSQASGRLDGVYRMLC